MTSEPVNHDTGSRELFAALRRTWTVSDPVPVGLADAMVATVAAADLDRDYALLALVDSDATAAVRGDADLFTLQFSDGRTNLLVHVTPSERGTRRLDGWVDGDVAEVRLLHEGDERGASCADGRFSFDDVAPGVSRLRVVLAKPEPGAPAELLTPRFEL